MNLGHRPPPDTPWERWIASGAALDAAVEWRDARYPYVDDEPEDADLLDAYLGTAQASDDHAEWCRQQILEHLADERDAARERGAAL